MATNNPTTTGGRPIPVLTRLSRIERPVNSQCQQRAERQTDQQADGGGQAGYLEGKQGDLDGFVHYVIM